MAVDLFLWPMLLPFLIPIFFTIRVSKKNLTQIIAMTCTAALIVLSYSTLISLQWFGVFSYAIWKSVLFIFIPILLITSIEKKKLKETLKSFGIQKKGLKKSILFACLLIPIMLMVMFLILWSGGISNDGDIFLGILSFFESLTEEIYFRGILLLYLWKKTSLPVAYTTSLGSFILHHPQHFLTLFLISTIVQGILTSEIARRTNNILGSWLLHGINRLGSIAFFPFIL